MDKLSRVERKGLRNAGITLLFIIAITLIGVIPSQGILRGVDGGILSSPLIKGVVSMLFITAALMGIVYGFTIKKYRSDADVMSGMGEAMKSLAMYYVLVFFAAQFVAYFKWSNLGIIFAIKLYTNTMSTRRPDDIFLPPAQTAGRTTPRTCWVDVTALVI